MEQVRSIRPAVRMLVVYELLLTFICVQGYNFARVLAGEAFWLALFTGSVPVFLFYFLRRLTDSVEISQDSVTMSSGILWRRSTRIPFHKITDASASRRPLPRILGLADLKLNTAGSTEHEIVMRDLKLRDAKNVVGLIDAAAANLVRPAAAAAR